MKSILLMKGSSGADVDALRVQLGALLARGGDAALPLGAKGEAISNDLDAAIRRWQAGIGVIADGIVGPRSRLLLGLDRPAPLQPPLDLAFVCMLFPATKPANIARYLPYVEAALGVAGLTDRKVVLDALATIRAETEGFVPLAEVKAVLESARDAYSDHPGLSDRSEYQAATQVVTTDFFRDLMTALETRFGEGKP